MASERVERWDGRTAAWVPLNGRARVSRFLSTWPLGRVATGGLLILFALAPLERGLFFPDARLPFEVLIAMLAVVAAVDRGVAGEGPLWGRPMDWALLAYAAGYLLAALIHPAAPGPALDGAFLGMALLVWYWSSAHLLRGEARIRSLANTVFASGVLLSLLGALAAAGIFQFPYAVLWGRVLSTLQYPNALAAWIIAAAYAGCGLMIDTLSRPAGLRGQWALAGYGAGLGLMTVILVGTYSRGGWLLFVLAGLLWFLGIHAASRRDALVAAAWPILTGLLMSRAFMEVFRRVNASDHPSPITGASEELLVVVAAAALGALGPVLYRNVRRALRRQRWSDSLRRGVIAASIAYGALALLLLALLARHDAVRGGEGILGSTFAQRLHSVGLGAASAQTRFSLWADAWRLIRHRPLQGYGGGGWAALYHQVQSSDYWITVVHGSVPQAWVDGGLLAAGGLVAVGVLILLRGWQRRREGASGPVLWGLAVGGFALWAHALIDFDLSIPALALLLWMIAGALRRVDPVAADRPVRRFAVAGGLAVTGVCAVALLLYGQRFGYGQRLGAFSGAAMQAHQYAQAYVTGQEALALDPLTAAYRADDAQLLAAAYSVNNLTTERHDALQQAAAAMRLDPGDFNSQVAALNVALALRAWPSLHDWSATVLDRFPLSGLAYERVGTVLVEAAETELSIGDATSAHADLALASGLQQRFDQAGRRLRRAGLGQAVLPPGALLAEGQAAALLGRDEQATIDLGPLAQQGDPTAAGWLAAVQLRLGNTADAHHLLKPQSGAAGVQAAFTSAQEFLSAARVAGP